MQTKIQTSRIRLRASTTSSRPGGKGEKSCEKNKKKQLLSILISSDSAIWRSGVLHRIFPTLSPAANLQGQVSSVSLFDLLVE